MYIVYVILLVAIVLLLAFAGLYNSLVRKRNQADNAFGLIDVMLKKRYDLIPNLVATVQQYAAHEHDTLARLTELRRKPYQALSAEEKSAFDQDFSQMRTSLMAVVENYPLLRASDNFMQLQRALNETEEQLAAARRTYNACVTDYNNAVQTFPSNLLASMFHFTTRTLLSIPEAERVAPDVKSLFNA